MADKHLPSTRFNRAHDLARLHNTTFQIGCVIADLESRLESTKEYAREQTRQLAAARAELAALRAPKKE